MDTTAPPNLAGTPIPEESVTNDAQTESARSKSVPGAELPLVTAREGQIVLTEEVLRSHAGSVGYPQNTILPSRTPLFCQPSPTMTGPCALCGSIAHATSYHDKSGLPTPTEPERQR